MAERRKNKALRAVHPRAAVHRSRDVMPKWADTPPGPKQTFPHGFYIDDEGEMVPVTLLYDPPRKRDRLGEAFVRSFMRWLRP